MFCFFSFPHKIYKLNSCDDIKSDYKVNKKQAQDIMIKLKNLEDGQYCHGDSEASLSRPPGFDMEKFGRGRLFFQQHILSCSIAMLFSLIVGMGIPELLEALIFTGHSDTPHKALGRYLSTFRHVALWHCKDIWDKNSEAHKSISRVRNMHKKVRSDLENYPHGHEKDSKKRKFLSQYDMGIVQSGFIGAIVMYPEKFGINCSKEDIDDYIYFWYGIGHLLGIERKYNICAFGYHQALLFCKEIEGIAIDNENRLSTNYVKMTKAVIDGFSHGQKFFTPFSFEVIQFLTYDAMSMEAEPLSRIDSVRYYIFKFIFFICMHCPLFNKFMKFVVEKVFEVKFN